jgi:hypothetical protein
MWLGMEMRNAEKAEWCGNRKEIGMESLLTRVSVRK